jgi:AcrR family transcriptional regulator
MATRMSRPEQVRRNRGLVLEAARRVFLHRGYAGATLDAIADEAGFSKGVVYSQFDGKPDLLLALLEQRIEERAAANAERAAGLTGVDGLRSLLRTNARLGDEDADWTQLVIEFRVVAARDAQLNARYAAAHARTVGHLAETLAGIAARGRQRLVLGPRHTAELILALGAGVSLERTAEPGALPEPVLEELVTRLAEPI